MAKDVFDGYLSEINEARLRGNATEHVRGLMPRMEKPNSQWRGKGNLVAMAVLRKLQSNGTIQGQL